MSDANLVQLGLSVLSGLLVLGVELWATRRRRWRGGEQQGDQATERPPAQSVSLHGTHGPVTVDQRQTNVTTVNIDRSRTLVQRTTAAGGGAAGDGRPGEVDPLPQVVLLALGGCAAAGLFAVYAPWLLAITAGALLACVAIAAFTARQSQLTGHPWSWKATATLYRLAVTTLGTCVVWYLLLRTSRSGLNLLQLQQDAVSSGGRGSSRDLVSLVVDLLAPAGRVVTAAGLVGVVFLLLELFAVVIVLFSLWDVFRDLLAWRTHLRFEDGVTDDARLVARSDRFTGQSPWAVLPTTLFLALAVVLSSGWVYDLLRPHLA